MNANKKYLDLGFGAVALIVWLMFRQLFVFAWEFFRLPVYENFAIGIPDVLAFLLALVVFVVLKRNAKISEFGLEVISELSKVTWPTRKETMVSTGVIMVMVAIASVLMFGIDTLWGTLTRSFLEF